MCINCIYLYINIIIIIIIITIKILLLLLYSMCIYMYIYICVALYHPTSKIQNKYVNKKNINPIIGSRRSLQRLPLF
jgi:hypothetical protein